MNHDTICALATANGIGAIGIIRISGNQSFEIVNKVFQGKNIEKADSHTVHYGFVVDGKVHDSDFSVSSSAENNIQPEIIDEVMVSIFQAPKTFTAEDSVEISFHCSLHFAY